MKIIAIDPGPEQSASVLYDTEKAAPCEWAIWRNEHLLAALIEEEVPPRYSTDADKLAIEMVACYGMPVGKSIFETAFWAGRFVQAFPGPHVRIYRQDVKLFLCNSMRAKDANIRQALIDRFPATGGGKTPQVGTKKRPGPLYGFHKDLWSALAVAVTAAEGKDG